MSDKTIMTKIKRLEALVLSMNRTQKAQDEAQESLHKCNVKQREALEKIIKIAERALKPCKMKR